MPGRDWPGPNLKVASGPILVNADIDREWGGHTFAYLIEVERCLFFSAIAYAPGGKSWTALVGQYPKPGSNGVGRVMPIPFTENNIHNVTQPLFWGQPTHPHDTASDFQPCSVSFEFLFKWTWLSTRSIHPTGMKWC